MPLLDVAQDVAKMLAAEPRLVRLDSGVRTVFAGDIHGDLDAVERVFSLVQFPAVNVVFLGDVVDRGPASRECLQRILTEKLEHPQSVHLLMGNHEAWGVAKFRPADFWHSLAAEEADALSLALLTLPLAAWHSSGLLAVHGALPSLPTLDDISSVTLGSEAWRDITWGDWCDHPAPARSFESRPIYNGRDFMARAARLGVDVLVRSHQPDAPSYLFGDRCLTLFTSDAYGSQRRIALLSANAQVRTARDLAQIEI